MGHPGPQVRTAQPVGWSPDRARSTARDLPARRPHSGALRRPCRLHVRQRRELECAAICAHHLRAPHDVIALPLSGLIASSALTGDVDVPEGHYAAETMRQTVVPNRNMVMLAIAGAVAVSEGAEALAIGVHGGDHFIYPDCRPEFVSAFETALLVATIGHRPD